MRALPDAWYLRLMYWRRQRELLHLKNPKTYSAKIQWLKLYGALDRYAPYVDKHEVRGYVAKTIGPEYLVPMIGVWRDFDDIPFSEVPDRFVLKATHGQGYNFICRDKSALEVPALRLTAMSWMSENFYRREREPQYRDILPQLIVESYLEDDSGALRDYKFPCFNGVPYLVQVLGDRARGTTENFYDLDWNQLQVQESGFPNSLKAIPKPAALHEMIGLAAKLSSRFPFVRVDFYYVDGRIYFGELTFTPASGIISYRPRSFDREVGRMMDLSGFSDLSEPKPKQRFAAGSSAGLMRR
jgi:hypothetical protein